MKDYLNRLEETLPKGFSIRTIRNEEDIQKAIQLNARIHGNDAGELVKGLCTRHPTMRLQDCLFIEEETTNKMVSFLCLIPLKWSYEGIELKVAEMGCVGTLEAYRRRGFIKVLNQLYEQRLREDRYDLSVIEGIPYFYRQFGYEYALPLNEECTIRLDQIPEDKSPKNTIIRPLTPHDIPKAKHLLEQTLSNLSIHTIRHDSIWLYQEKQKMAGGIPFQSLAIESNGSMTGYFRLNKSEKAVSILEVSELNYNEILEALKHAKSIAQKERKEPFVRIKVPPSSSFVKVAKALGAEIKPAYAYQIRIPDIRRFLTKITPVLHERIQNSVFRGLTATIKINIYTTIIKLHFANGHLQKVTSAPPAEEREIRLRPLLLYQLLMGYKSREELCTQYLDCSVRGEMQHIIDVLFPKTTSHLHPGY